MNWWDPLGLREYSCAETQGIIDQARKQASPPWGVFNAFNNHRPRGKYDFKYYDAIDGVLDDYYNVDGRRMRSDAFGNYLAGYSGEYAAGTIGYAGVRAGGIVIDFTDTLASRARLSNLPNNGFDWDMDSVPDINAGANRAKDEIAPRSSPWDEMNSSVNHIGGCSCP
jgi:hypothetical protein